jgi:hypothetical protein
MLMLSRLHSLDTAIGRTRPAWRWIGEFSLVALGVHLAADHCEDWLFDFFVQLGIGQADPIAWATPAAILLELLVASRVMMVLLLTAGAPPPTWRDFRQNWSVEAFTRLLFWVPTGLAGAWTLGMALEDAMSPLLGEGAFYLAVLFSALTTWRLILPVLGRLIGGLFPPRRRSEGWFWAPPLLLTAALAARHGLPIWGVIS